jgi:poly-gamma-glutamate synthesis protein (capsule biosynthesis protein)
MRLALAGDTMLGRGVADLLAAAPDRELLAAEVVAAIAEADVFILNLECSISARGQSRASPEQPFAFRAPPAAAAALAQLSVTCVTLANNHALDFGDEALLDTFDYLKAEGIVCVGAGPDLERARRPVVLDVSGFRLGVVAVTDHPAGYAAGAGRPGVAYADLWNEPMPGWLLGAVHGLDADAVLVTPHWGPNMVAEPVAHVREAADELVDAGATLVAGHSAHVFHGVGGRVLYDLGDFLDDYATDPDLRNDLGLLYLVELERDRPVRLEAIPLELEYCHTRLATGANADWIRRRFHQACADLGTGVAEEAGRLVVSW